MSANEITCRRLPQKAQNKNRFMCIFVADSGRFIPKPLTFATLASKSSAPTFVIQPGDIAMKSLATALTVIIIFAATATAQTWDPETQLKVKAMGTPRVSPDGKRMVYTV